MAIRSSRHLASLTRVMFTRGWNWWTNSKPSVLDLIYGSHPVSWKLFLRLRPGKMGMSMHEMHGKSKEEETIPTKP